ncbi:hypothetical protein Clacol_003928 [Clathrus columnatus]|uniref:RNI-like protein n=1 Tax=Clathrus columnatus TaxID=1419009 RepID=A0AAV5A516_9AGAM|nr:hypothetical protein Clacol_003928 [Clathrus columnatus]
MTPIFELWTLLTRSREHMAASEWVTLYEDDVTNHGFAAPVSDDENPLVSQSLFDEKRRETTQYWLKTLPEAIIPRLFAVLSGTHPTLLSHGLMIAYFLRGDPIILSGSIPGVSAPTIQALAKINASLRECHLKDLNKISDDVFASLFSKLSMCEILVLKGSTKVGKKSIDAIANTCKHLRVLNLNFTSAPPASIAFLTGECIELEILKLAGISLINDGSFADILHISDDSGIPLRRLRRLKLRHTSITNQSLKWIGSICIHLTHLDVSFTPIKQPLSLCDSSTFIPELEKLSLTSTPLTPTFLLRVQTNVLLDSPLKFLRTLHIGAIGASPSPRIRSTPDSLTLTDDVLDSLTDALYECKLLENVLNLAAISRLTSSDLSGLPPVEHFTDEIGDDPAVYEASPLQTLNINNTAVDNEAAEYIATCPGLQILNLAGTKLDC